MIEADAVHEQIAGRDLAGGLVEAEPGLLEDVLFGAAAVSCIDARFAAHLMEAWDTDISSLLPLMPAKSRLMERLPLLTPGTSSAGSDWKLS